MFRLLCSSIITVVSFMLWTTTCFASYCELIANDAGNEMSWNGITDVCNVPDRVCITYKSLSWPICQDYIEICFVADEGISFTDYSCKYHADGTADPTNPFHFTTVMYRWELISRVGTEYAAAICHPIYDCGNVICPTQDDFDRADDIVDNFNQNGGVWVQKKFECGPNCHGEFI